MFVRLFSLGGTHTTIVFAVAGVRCSTESKRVLVCRTVSVVLNAINTRYVIILSQNGKR